MAEGTEDQPLQKKIKLDLDNGRGAPVDYSVFIDFKKDEDRKLDLKHAVLALNQ